MAILVQNGHDISGLLADRPDNVEAGQTFYATDSDEFFVHNGTAWNSVSGAAATAIAGATLAVGAEAADVINVTIQLTDAAGNDLATIGVVHAYLSGDSGGDGILATAPTGGVAIGTDGAIVVEEVTNKAWILSSEADGDIDLDITDVGTPTMYLVVVLPSGEKVVSDAITFA